MLWVFSQQMQVALVNGLIRTDTPTNYNIQNLYSSTFSSFYKPEDDEVSAAATVRMHFFSGVLTSFFVYHNVFPSHLLISKL